MYNAEYNIQQPGQECTTVHWNVLHPKTWKSDDLGRSAFSARRYLSQNIWFQKARQATDGDGTEAMRGAAMRGKSQNEPGIALKKSSRKMIKHSVLKNRTNLLPDAGRSACVLHDLDSPSSAEQQLNPGRMSVILRNLEEIICTVGAEGRHADAISDEEVKKRLLAISLAIESADSVRSYRSVETRYRCSSVHRTLRQDEGGIRGERAHRAYSPSYGLQLRGQSAGGVRGLGFT
ncbi:hypothetical protein BS47DRAFT_1400176 [Hydnum rufescens UP504]|uniref:Uncharacterized protein n=1 Tax=Hydnum rufescens UP504 TaxID=1448309 RepID=A0A9P6DL98_9AGAM|nr:hypothetical protein BS47DRAFT_1400176 [Hydnum rufescens UP504]